MNCRRFNRIAEKAQPLCIQFSSQFDAFLIRARFISIKQK
jgi:hypothetical protein